jgi:endonuclease/exonuclease/phosphatase family metal-dependent hydrolase
MQRFFYSSILVISIFSISCVQKPKPVFTEGYKPAEGAITVMTYNVENLFDTQDDPLKNDEAFLPVDKKNERVRTACRVGNEGNNYRLNECLTKDWSEKILKMKMKRLTDVVKQVKGGRGPDVLILQEVENVGILDRWRTEYLSKMGYQPALLIEGPDKRGIDVGIMTRLEVAGPMNLHLIPFKANEQLKEDQIRETRGILEATLKLPDGTPLTVFAIHFPSQGAPTETRKQSVEFLNTLKAKVPKNHLVIAGGDFNITSDEEFKTGYIGTTLAKNWGVSHLVGCKECIGTTYYNGTRSWSFFDILLMSPELLPDGAAPWRVVPESIRIENNSVYQTNRYGSPARFSEDRKDGVSDHWPMVMEILKR